MQRKVININGESILLKKDVAIIKDVPLNYIEWFILSVDDLKKLNNSYILTNETYKKVLLRISNNLIVKLKLYFK